MSSITLVYNKLFALAKILIVIATALTARLSLFAQPALSDWLKYLETPPRAGEIVYTLEQYDPATSRSLGKAINLVRWNDDDFFVKQFDSKDPANDAYTAEFESLSVSFAGRYDNYYSSVHASQMHDDDNPSIVQSTVTGAWHTAYRVITYGITSFENQISIQPDSAILLSSNGTAYARGKARIDNSERLATCALSFQSGPLLDCIIQTRFTTTNLSPASFTLLCNIKRKGQPADTKLASAEILALDVKQSNPDNFRKDLLRVLPKSEGQNFEYSRRAISHRLGTNLLPVYPAGPDPNKVRTISHYIKWTLFTVVPFSAIALYSYSRSQTKKKQGKH